LLWLFFRTQQQTKNYIYINELQLYWAEILIKEIIILGEEISEIKRVCVLGSARTGLIFTALQEGAQPAQPGGGG